MKHVSVEVEKNTNVVVSTNYRILFKYDYIDTAQLKVYNSHDAI